MEEWLDAGNPSSLYAEGRRARQAVDLAREAVSEAMGCLFAELLFTSGGTEAANMALVGAALANEDARRSRILLGAAEHHCVLHTKPMLERLGYRVEFLPVDREARLDLDRLEAAVGDDVLLVGAMHANNELGTLNDVAAIAAIVHRRGALLHTDAVQTFGKLPWKVDDLAADLVTVSAHKRNGPKGAGALYLRAGTRLKPFVAGGGQERELRGGTENVAALAGFGAAVRRAPAPSELSEASRVLRDRLLAMGAVPTAADPLPTHVHVRFPGIPAETLLIVLDRMGVNASSGAACSSGSVEPSHVLLACGYTEQEAKEGVRFSLGLETSRADVEEAAGRIEEAVNGLRPRAR